MSVPICLLYYRGGISWSYLYPRYEEYRGYIVFSFSVIMFVCLFLFVNFFSVKDCLATSRVR